MDLEPREVEDPPGKALGLEALVDLVKGPLQGRPGALVLGGEAEEGGALGKGLHRLDAFLDFLVPGSPSGKPDGGGESKEGIPSLLPGSENQPAKLLQLP